ncbi:MAG: hypothetical protein ACLUS6_15830 [Dysosmobacter sp.]
MRRQALAEMAELSRGESFPLLYGCGSTTGIAAALEKGRVTADCGGQRVLRRVSGSGGCGKAARHEDWTGAPHPWRFPSVRQETMYEQRQPKLLFPVTLRQGERRTV